MSLKWHLLWFNFKDLSQSEYFSNSARLITGELTSHILTKHHKEENLKSKFSVVRHHWCKGGWDAPSKTQHILPSRRSFLAAAPWRVLPDPFFPLSIREYPSFPGYRLTTKHDNVSCITSFSNKFTFLLNFCFKKRQSSWK